MRQTLAFSVLTIMTIYPETTILILVLTMLALHIASKLISNNIFQNQYNGEKIRKPRPFSVSTALPQQSNLTTIISLN